MTINDIKPYEKNAKKHPKTQLVALAAIVKEVGWRQPVLVNHKTGVIVAGHGRFETWTKYKKEYELKDVWVINDIGETVHGNPETTPMTEEQEKAYRLADNKLNESEWDKQLLVPELKSLSWEMLELTGFDKDLIKTPEDKEDEVPEVPVEAKSKKGDIYILGDHVLMCGDSTDDADVSKLMNGEKADLVFTDPPYNVNYKGKGKNTSNGIKNDNMGNTEFDEFLDKVFKNYQNHSKPTAPAYVFHASSTQAQFEYAMNKNGFEVKTQLIWNKPLAVLGWGDYMWKHEPFFYAAKSGQSVPFYGDRTNKTVLDFTKTEAELVAWAKKVKESENNGKTTIWTMKKDRTDEYVHPTQKPVELIQTALSNSSKVYDVVIDLFGGSGSTLIACEKMERKARTMELDPKYVDVIVQRYVDYTENHYIVKNGIEGEWGVDF